MRNSIFWVLCIVFSLSLAGCQGCTDKEKELSALSAEIDMELYQQSKADIHAWLDQMIDVSAEFGVCPDHRRHVIIADDEARISFGDGWAAEPAAMFFRAYEMLGDSKYLDAALRFCDFLLKAQQPRGHFPGSARVYPRMLDDIDPEVHRPVYRTEGEIVIVGIAPGTATITARTTDGHHTAKIEVQAIE